MSAHSKTEKRITVILLSLIVVLLVIIASVSIIYLQATQPMRQAKQEATTLAKQYGDVTTVDTFYRLSKNDTSYTVVGKNAKNQEVVVFIPKDGTNIKVLETTAGIEETKAKTIIKEAHPDQQIEKVNLGLLDGTPVWEVITTKDQAYSYYYLAFTDGSVLKEIQQI